MANRPRRLDEIDKAFGESMKAKEAIKAAEASVSEEPSRSEVPETPKTVLPVQDGFKPISAQGAVEDISAVADEFIMRFGTPERAAATTRLRENETMRAKVIPTKSATRSGTATGTKASPVDKSEKTRGISSEAATPVAPPISRVTPLMDDYQRVMNDEDDDSFFSQAKRGKKTSKVRTKKKPALITKKTAPTDPIYEETDDSFDVPVVSFEVPEEFRGIEEASSGDTAETVADEVPVVEYESTEAGYSLSDESLSAVADDASEYGDYDDILSRYDDAEEVVEVDGEDEDEYYVESRASGKGHKAGKILLSIALIFTMLTACGVGAARLLLGVNTGKIIAEKYSIFTCDKDYPFLELKAGDLIITEDGYPMENKNVVYADSETDDFAFGKYIASSKGNDGKIYCAVKSGEYDENIDVARESIRGVIKSNIPAVGNFVSAVSNYYIVIIALLLCIAVLLLLIIIFGFSSGGKREAYVDSGEDEEDEEADNDYSLSDE